MRVEPCGNLEPTKGDTLLDRHHQSQRLSEPISIINPKINNTNSNYLSSDKERSYSELSLFDGDGLVAGRNSLNLAIGAEPEHHYHTLPIGFFLSDEEWSSFKQPAIGLEPYERKKMSSLPKSFTPLALALGGLSLEGRSSSVIESASESTLSRQLESPNGTPALPKLSESEQNNNEILQESGCSKLTHTKDVMSDQNDSVVDDGPKLSERKEEKQDDTESVLSSDECGPLTTTITTSSSSMNSSFTEKLDNMGHHEGTWKSNLMEEEGISRHLLNIGILGVGYPYLYPPLIHHTNYYPSSVDTIDSHPLPISSSCRDQVHSPSHLHHHLPCQASKNSFAPVELQQRSSVIEISPSPSYYLQEFNRASDQQKQSVPNTVHQLPDAVGISNSFAQNVNEQQLSFEIMHNKGNYNSGIQNKGLTLQEDSAVPADPLSENATESTLMEPGVGGQQDEMETLFTFLSKFDDKVAAIWGQDGAAAAAAIFAANLQQSTSGLSGSNSNSYASHGGSNSSTPTGCPSNLSYAWGSPSVPPSQAMGHGFNYPGVGIPMVQSEQQQRALAESQRQAESFYQKQYLSLQRKDYPQDVNLNPPQHKPNPHKNHHHVHRNENKRIAIGSPRLKPPQGKHTIMHSILEYFGHAPSENEYHIVREVDAGSSIEETAKSLKVLNHSEETSGFVRFVHKDMLPVEEKVDHETAKLQKTTAEGRDEAPTEVEVQTMQDVLESLDLECDEELEIVAACKGHPKPFIEPPPLEDLLHSWKTHFNPLEVLEAKDEPYIESPDTQLLPHQINPNLPDYVMYQNAEFDYRLFDFRCRTLFPIKFKVRKDNDKSCQTETLAELTQTNVHQHDSDSSCKPYTVFDWDGFAPENQHPYILTSRLMSPTETLSRYDFENNLEFQTSEWNTADGTTGLGSGSLVELDYNYNRGGGDGIGGAGGTLVGGNQQYLSTDYCCDSGIGIDVCSRSGFYEDYDLDGTEYYGGGAMGDDSGGATLLQHQHPHMVYAAAGNGNDVDYGQFQSYSVYPVEMSSSVSSGKHGKGSRRRAKVKPCKYFFLDGSCRRGKECKFSHDLTTCRYWAEGSCLKGETCPYLHCFLDRNDLGWEQESSNGAAASKRYMLESENDFPALGLEKTKSNATGSSRVPMSYEYPPSPYSLDENGPRSGHSGAVDGGLVMLADPAGCGSILDNNYGFNQNTFGGNGEQNIGISGFRKNGQSVNFGFPTDNADRYKLASRSLMNNNKGTATEQTGTGLGRDKAINSRGNIGKQKKAGNRRYVFGTAAVGTSSSADDSTDRLRPGKDDTMPATNYTNWNSSFAINTKEKRKKKKH